MTSRKFIINLFLIVTFLGLVIFGIFQWLKVYTNHGQRLELPSYIDQNISDAGPDAEARDFNLIVNDSTHIVGKPGGVILNQNPKGGSFVKEKRKVYVTISKYSPDLIDISSLPRLYGENFEIKSEELRSRQLTPHIKEHRHDQFTNYTILEVWYDGQKIIDKTGRKKNIKIEKGGHLNLVISSDEGGSAVIPNLIGKKLSAAELIINSRRFLLGNVVESGTMKPEDRGTATVIEQYPEHDGMATMTTGEKINVVIRSR